MSSQSFGTVVVTQTSDPSTLASALGGANLTIDSVSVTHGTASQIGTFSNFSLISPGVVLSTGNVASVDDTPGSTPITSTGAGGTPEFNAYGPGNITHFSSSNDVARIQVDFTLSTASAVAFDFIFGTVEYPDFVANFTDSFLTFLDGTAPGNQITFDANGDPVSVGNSFAGQVITSNTETVFSDPHGILPLLTTTTGTLAAGSHTIIFEIGDVNDSGYDSAVFLANFRAAVGTGGGPVTVPTAVPEPSSMILAGTAVLVSLGYVRRRRNRAAA